MNESLTGLLVILSEVGVVLALFAVGFIIYLLRRRHQDNKLVQSFVNTLRQGELGRKENIMDILQKVHEMDKELAEKTALAMLACEKKIYSKALKLFMGHQGDCLAQLQKDVEHMAASYRKLATTAENVNIIERGDNPKQVAQFRATIKQLTAERDKLQKDLDEAMLSMDSMLQEYTQMYSGGGAKKEGLKHIENELLQLKDKIKNNLVEVDDDEEADAESQQDQDGVPDLEPPKPGEGAL